MRAQAKGAFKIAILAIICTLLIVATLSAASANIADVKLLSADIAVTQNVVAGKFKLQNPTGTGDMTKMSLIEMSIRKPGGAFLALFGPQEMCDPTHQENVHKDYMLSGGESIILSLSTPPLPDGKYEVWCETANACYAANPATFKSEGPCSGGMRLAELDMRATTSTPTLTPTQPTVGTGGTEQAITVTPSRWESGRFPIMWKAVGAGALLLLLAYASLHLGLLYIGIPAFFVGLFLLGFGLRGGQL